MKEGLERLYALQQKDDRIKEIASTIEEIPRTINRLETERDDKREVIEKVKAKREENVKARKKLEGEIALLKEKIARYREQMNKSTTNKEYQGFITEIQYEENRISEVEEQIIQRMLEFDEIMDEIRASEEEFKKIAESFNEKITELKSSMQFEKDRLREESESREKLRKEIPANLLKVYDMLFVKKAGKAVSLVEFEFCGICNIKIRPQLLNELISSNSLFVCENCGRILYKPVEREKETAS